MTLKEAIKDYRDPSGLVTPELRPTIDASGNGITYTNIYFTELVLKGLARVEDLLDYCKTMDPCFDKPGLIDRSPTEFKERDQNSFDDYTWLCTGSKLMRARYAQEVLKYGKSTGRTPFTKYVYNNVDHDKWTFKSWLGRQPQFVAHLYFSNNEKPCWALRKYWSGHMNSVNFDNDVSVLLSWARALAYPEGMDDACDIAVINWREELMRARGGMGPVIAAHFKKPEHPLSLHAPAY